MKKSILTGAFIAALMGATLNVNADNNCQVGNSNCNQTSTLQCDTTATPLAVKVYDKAKEGTVNAYDKVADGTVNVYDKAKDGTVKTYNKVADGTENVYNKAADGTVKAYDKTKNAVEKGANAVKEEWNKIF